MIDDCDVDSNPQPHWYQTGAGGLPGVSTKENAGAEGTTSPTGHELDALDCDCMMVIDDCDVDLHPQHRPHRHQTLAGGLPGVSTKENAGAGGTTSPTGHELCALDCDCMIVIRDSDVDLNPQHRPHRYQTWAGGLPGVSTKENAGAGGATSPADHELDALDWCLHDGDR